MAHSIGLPAVHGIALFRRCHRAQALQNGRVPRLMRSTLGGRQFPPEKVLDNLAPPDLRGRGRATGRVAILATGCARLRRRALFPYLPNVRLDDRPNVLR